MNRYVGTAELMAHTPRAVDAAVLKRLTVGRAHELSVLRAALQDAAKSLARPHTLVVGTRGAGKSHLLTLIAHEILSGEFQGKFKLAWFPEDIYSITSYRDFLSEIVTQIGLPSPPFNDPVATVERSIVDSTALIPVVVIAENLNRTMDLIGNEGQHSLRAFLHNQSSILLLASTPSLFDGVTSHREPFFGAFRTLSLVDLTLDEGRELLLKAARNRNDDALGEFLLSPIGRARLAAVEHLTGGLPRIWVMIAACVNVQLLDELLPLFLRLLDDLAPYYKARMDELAPAKAKAMSALCFARSGGAMTVAEVASTTGASPQSTAKLLGDLERDRFVRKTKIPGTDQRTTYYEIREPLLRHCLDLKRNAGRPLTLIVEILRSWYEGPELRQLTAQIDAGSLAEQYLAEALRRDQPIESVDRMWASGSIEDLLVEIRSRGRGRASTRVAIEVVAVECRDGVAASVELLARRKPDMDPDEFLRCEGLLDSSRVEVMSTTSDRTLVLQRTAADRLEDRLRAMSENDPADHYLALVAAGWILGRGSSPAAAVEILRASLANIDLASSDDEVVIASFAEFAVALFETGEREVGAELGRAVLSRRLEVIGADHPDTLTSRANVAFWIGRTGSPSRARDLYERVAADQDRVLGPDHPQTLASRNNLASWTGENGDPTRARELFEHIVADYERLLGRDHPNTLNSRNNFALWIGQSGDPTRARGLFEHIVLDHQRVLGVDHPQTLASRHNLAFWTAENGDPTCARDLYENIAADRKRVLGSDHPSTLASHYNLAFYAGRTGDPTRAREIFEQVAADYQRVLGSDHPDTLRCHSVAALLAAQYGQSIEALRDLIAVVQATPTLAKGLEQTIRQVTLLIVLRWKAADRRNDETSIKDDVAALPRAGGAGVFVRVFIDSDGLSERIAKLAVQADLSRELFAALGGLHEVPDRILPVARIIRDAIGDATNPIHRLVSAVVAGSEGDLTAASSLVSEERQLVFELIDAAAPAEGATTSAPRPRRTR